MVLNMLKIKLTMIQNTFSFTTISRMENMFGIELTFNILGLGRIRDSVTKCHIWVI